MAGFIGFLLLSNYTSLQKLRASSLQQYQIEFEQRALDLSHLLNDRNHNVQDLAASNSVSLFFKNKSLGMSMAYGLRSSIRNIDKELLSFIEASSHGDNTLFTQLAFYDRAGKKIASSVSSIKSKNAIYFPWEKVKDLTEGLYLYGSDKGRVEGLTYILPYYFKGALEGRFVLIFNVKTLIDEYSRDGDPTLFTGVSYPLERLIPLLSKQQLNKGPGEQWIISEHDVPTLKKAYAQKDDVILFSQEVGQKGYKLIEIASAKTVLGKTSPKTLLLALVLIGIIILVAFVMLVRGSIRNLTLQARIDESHKRAKVIEQKNRQLEKEMEERKRAEELRIQLEADLRKSQKMETIGLLAGGVAHDLNNILSGIVSYPEVLLLDMPADSPYRKPLSIIQASGQKAAAIVQDLLTLARRGVAVRNVVNLNKIVFEYLDSPDLKQIKSFHTGVDIEVELAPDLDNNEGSPIHLMKTVMNLVANAAESIQSKGKISIQTENRSITQVKKTPNCPEPGEYSVLTISDTGEGIPDDNLERIFEPFYTKKEMGRSGTGLGLAIVWGTVQDHNGHIEVSSKEDEGTTFTLYFPRTDLELPKASQALSIENYTGEGQSVLIIDDDSIQRKIASEMINRLGYTVASVASGEEAVDYLFDNSADLLILDMIMVPGIDGLETYKRILSHKPDQKAIITSGYSETSRVKEAQRAGAARYLRKPYTIEEIGVAIKNEFEN